jgi:hypothetical protein
MVRQVLLPLFRQNQQTGSIISLSFSGILQRIYGRLWRIADNAPFCVWHIHLRTPDKFQRIQRKFLWNTLSRVTSIERPNCKYRRNPDQVRCTSPSFLCLVRADRMPRNVRTLLRIHYRLRYNLRIVYVT